LESEMKFKVYLVDDDMELCKEIDNFLNKNGYEVHSAHSITEAKNNFQNIQPDIILLDVQLPDGHGPTLLKETSNLPMRPPIIVITAFGDIEMAVDAMKNGASREDLLNGFIYAAEFNNLCWEYGISPNPIAVFVARFYQLCLSRSPDRAGLDGCQDQAASGAGLRGFDPHAQGRDLHWWPVADSCKGCRRQNQEPAARIGVGACATGLRASHEQEEPEGCLALGAELERLSHRVDGVRPRRA